MNLLKKALDYMERTLDTVYFGFLFKTGNKTVIIKNRFHKIRVAQNGDYYGKTAGNFGERYKRRN